MYSPLIIICSIQQTFYIINVSRDGGVVSKRKIIFTNGISFSKIWCNNNRNTNDTHIYLIVNDRCSRLEQKYLFLLGVGYK